MTKLEEIKHLIKTIDNTYQYSDDHSVYNRNRNIFTRISELSESCIECKKLYESNKLYLWGITNEIGGL